MNTDVIGKQQQPNSRELGVVFILCLLFSMLFTWPLVTELGSSFIGDKSHTQDLTYAWNAYNFNRQIEDGENLMATSQLFFPDTVSLWRNATMPLASGIASTFSNPYTGFNVIILLHFILTAFGVYLLARRWLTNAIASSIVAVSFTFAPMQSTHLWAGHINLLLTATIPYFIIVLFAAFKWNRDEYIPRVTSRKYFVLTILLGFITLLNDYILSFQLIYLVLFICLLHWFAIFFESMKQWKKWAIVAVSVIAIDQIIQHLKRAGVSDGEAFYWGASLDNFLTPPVQSNFYSLMGLFDSAVDDERSLFIGYSLLLLSCFVSILLFKRFVRITPQVKLWVGIGLLSFMVAMPVFKVAGVSLIRLPTALLHFIPIWNENRCPARMSHLLWIALPLVCFWAIEQWPKWEILKSGLRNSILSVFLFVLVIEYLPNPYTLYPTEPAPQIYTQLRDMQGDGVLVLPFGIGDGKHRWGLWEPESVIFQFVHRKRLMGGYISRVPDEHFVRYQVDSLLTRLVRLQSDSTLIQYANTTHQTFFASQFLTRFPIKWVIIPPNWRNSNAARYVSSELFPYIVERREIDGYELISLQRISD